MTDLTATQTGIMIRVAGTLPDTCSAASSGWMLISQANSSIAATTLSFWLTGRKDMCVYADGYTGNYCNVTQVDPYE